MNGNYPRLTAEHDRAANPSIFVSFWVIWLRFWLLSVELLPAWVSGSTVFKRSVKKMNLTRLSGSGLLIDGFNDFLKVWFKDSARWDRDDLEKYRFADVGVSSNSKVLDRNEMPFELKRFWEVHDFWNFIPPNGQDKFYTKPISIDETDPDDGIPGKGFYRILTENQGGWEISIKATSDEWNCYRSAYDFSGWVRMAVDYADVLVHYALTDITTCSSGSIFDDWERVNNIVPGLAILNEERKPTLNKELLRGHELFSFHDGLTLDDIGPDYAIAYRKEQNKPNTYAPTEFHYFNEGLLLIDGFYGEYPQIAFPQGPRKT